MIVFGPTGNVGSIVALTAQQQSAKVFLAMRDTQKSIPGLRSAQELKGEFARVAADLMDPASVRSAVTQSRATAAFIYLTWQTKDGMKATLEALKAAGVEFVVFLSSFTIRGPLEKVSPANRIPYMHAQVELNLRAIYGEKQFVALRAGGFASEFVEWTSCQVLKHALVLHETHANCCIFEILSEYAEMEGRYCCGSCCTGDSRLQDRSHHTD